MAKRKSISKKTRFEVFKRDKFTCQYCGKSAPDVVLEVDHVVPVAEGGADDMLNLVTACFDCNRGKGARELSDDAVVKRQKKQLDLLQERREQLEMMCRWQIGLANEVETQIDCIGELMGNMTGRMPSDPYGRNYIRSWLQKYDFELVIEATRISFSQYPYGSTDEWREAFMKIPGICYNRTHKTCRQCRFNAGYSKYLHKVACELDEAQTYRFDNNDAEYCPDYENKFEVRRSD